MKAMSRARPVNTPSPATASKCPPRSRSPPARRKPKPVSTWTLAERTLQSSVTAADTITVRLRPTSIVAGASVGAATRGADVLMTGNVTVDGVASSPASSTALTVRASEPSASGRGTKLRRNTGPGGSERPGGESPGSRVNASVGTPLTATVVVTSAGGPAGPFTTATSVWRVRQLSTNADGLPTTATA